MAHPAAAGAGAGADSGWGAAGASADGKFRGSESRRFVPLAARAGTGGCDCRGIWGDRVGSGGGMAASHSGNGTARRRPDSRRDAGATWAAGDVAGGRSDHPNHDGLGWTSRLSAICAGDGVVWGGWTDRIERRRTELHPAESADAHSVWAGTGGGGVRNDQCILERVPVCGAAGFEFGGAVRAVAAGSDADTSRAADL